MMDERPLMGAHEIRMLLGGITRQRVYQLTCRPDFPAPVADLSQGKVWRTADVKRWVANRRRPPRRADPADDPTAPPPSARPDGGSCATVSHFGGPARDSLLASGDADQVLRRVDRAACPGHGRLR